MDNIQLFLSNKFTQKELVTKKIEIQQIVNLLNFLTDEDISVILEYVEFLKKLENPKGLENQKGSENPFFQKATRFEGHKSGYVFKNDNQGLGYYLDLKPIF